MKLLAAVLTALSLLAPAFAQTPETAPFRAPQPHGLFTDPANLGGERAAPLTGRELPVDQGVSGLEQLLRKLNTRASILNIVAHPDDEDGGMLTLYARGLGARVADISLTRGEGGQNAMTGDFEDALGLLRTQELLSNDRYTGVDQFFGTEVDFGFSKTKAESFAKWGHERVLYDVVRAIRIYRPLVITSSWIGNPTDGHGQHQVAGEIAQEAFVAAGDPKIFPELTAEGILPWQPLKIYARVPRQTVTPQGIYDSATGQYVPARFTNYITGKVTTTLPSTDIVIHEGTDDPLLTIAAANLSDLPPSLASDSPTTELSYVQFARIGLGLQKSQIGPGVRDARPGRFDVPYHLYASRVQAPPARSIPAQGNALGKSISEGQRAEGPLYNPAPQNQPSFFDGIDTSLAGIATLAPHAPAALRTELNSLAAIFAKAGQQAQAGDLKKTAAVLLQADTQLDCIRSTLAGPAATSDAGCRLSHPEQYAGIPKKEVAAVLHELLIKQAQLDEALSMAFGITMDAKAVSHNGDLTAGEPFTITARFVTSSKYLHPSGVKLEGTWVTPTSEQTPAAAGVAWNYTFEVVAPETQRFAATIPYFTRSSVEESVYHLLDSALRNAPQTPAPLVVSASFCPNSRCFSVARVVHGTDTSQPLDFVPPASLSLSSYAQVLPNSDTEAGLTLFESDNGPPITSEYDGGPANWKPLLLSVAANCIGCDPVAWRVPLGHRQMVTLRPSLTLKDGEVITEGYRAVGYGDLPRTNYYTPATDRIVPVDLKLPARHRIAYLPGTGDAVPAALDSIGLAPTRITVADLTPEKLSHFDTVILGVRTYAAHPDLHGAPTQALLDFARAGGNVVVQYQTPEFTAADAPYPLSLGSDEKVVDETAAVQLTAKSPLLDRPNTITSADFDGWIEERGHGFLSTWDPRYTALIETHDLGQLPQRGGLLTTRLGKGRWTYCAFALYRQLPEAVPGAYRLFVNLLDPD